MLPGRNDYTKLTLHTAGEYFFRLKNKMVALDKVQASNASVAKTYPETLVGVFAGATAGIGETSLREFARHTSKPRIYIIGRSKEACDRLSVDLKKVNPGGEYFFIRSDISLLRNVDEVCKDIRNKESAINVLFMSQGTLNFTKGKGNSYFFTIPTSRTLLKLPCSISLLSC